MQEPNLKQNAWLCVHLSKSKMGIQPTERITSISFLFYCLISNDLLPDLNVSSSKVPFCEYVHGSMAMAASLQVWLSEPGLRLAVCLCFVTTSDSLLVHPKRRCGGCLKQLPLRLGLNAVVALDSSHPSHFAIAGHVGRHAASSAAVPKILCDSN